MRRFKWFRITGGYLEPVKFEELKRDLGAEGFGFLVPKTPKFKEALHRAILDTSTAPKVVEYEGLIAVIYTPEDGLWAARSLRTALTLELKKMKGGS